ncbi:MAG: hypothetical protein LBU80_00755 [Rikenellaceae bacterium]|nr:hypothetical protein [Rikenellaceae bacterium]
MRSIRLTVRSDIVAIAYDESRDAYTSITLASGETPAIYTFGEEQATYRETINLDNGVRITTHTLAFSFDKMDADARKALCEIATASLCGLVAVVTTENNDTLLVGYSREMAGERPLRLAASDASTGAKQTDPGTVNLALESCDTAPARTFTGNFG